MAGVRRGAWTCVGWQVTLCDPIWQATSRSAELGFPGRALSAFFAFKSRRHNQKNTRLTFNVIYYSQHRHFPHSRAFNKLSPRC